MKPKQPAMKCGTCKHGSAHFKLSSGTHLHCQHPDDKISGAEHQSPWDTLREWYSTCRSWEAKAPVTPCNATSDALS